MKNKPFLYEILKHADVVKFYLSSSLEVSDRSVQKHSKPLTLANNFEYILAAAYIIYGKAGRECFFKRMFN